MREGREREMKKFRGWDIELKLRKERDGELWEREENGVRKGEYRRREKMRRMNGNEGK